MFITKSNYSVILLPTFSSLLLFFPSPPLLLSPPSSPPLCFLIRCRLHPPSHLFFRSLSSPSHAPLPSPPRFSLYFLFIFLLLLHLLFVFLFVVVFVLLLTFFFVLYHHRLILLFLLLPDFSSVSSSSSFSFSFSTDSSLTQGRLACRVTTGGLLVTWNLLSSAPVPATSSTLTYLFYTLTCDTYTLICLASPVPGAFPFHVPYKTHMIPFTCFVT